MAAAAHAAPRVSPSALRERNRFSWIGRAHNILVAEFMRENERTGGRRICEAFDRVWQKAPKLLGADSVHLPASSKSLSSATVKLPFRCGADSAIRPTSYSTPSPVPTPTFLSGDPAPYAEAIQGAVQAATDSTDLASLLDAILDDADGDLSGTELDYVYMTASMAIESWSYWFGGGLSSAQTGVENTYGSCLTLAEEPTTCLYDARFTQPRAQSPGLVRYVSLETVGPLPPCTVDGKSVVVGDVGGFFGGLIGSLGNPVVALASGFGTSGGVALVELVLFVWCAFHQ